MSVNRILKDLYRRHSKPMAEITNRLEKLIKAQVKQGNSETDKNTTDNKNNKGIIAVNIRRPESENTE